MPANYLSVCGGQCTQIPYFTFQYRENEALSDEDKIKALAQRYDIIFSRVASSLKGRQIALPLSGGRDSRLILFYLKKNGYNNIITFSYGYEGTEDQRLSKIVADYFGVDYHYVHCNRKKMRKMSRAHFSSYLSFAGNGCSLPCLQELYAVYELRQKGLIEPNCVFMPGHRGDFYAGARAVEVMGDNSDEWRKFVIDHLFFKEYKYKNTHKSEATRREDAERLLTKYGVVPACFSTRSAASECIEKYYFDERESKYIQNCVRYYDYWDYEWLAPLEDSVLNELWLSFPLSDRVERKFFHRFIAAIYPKGLLNIEFAGKPKTVLKLQWCYGFVPAIDYIQYRFFHRYISMNQFVWEKYKHIIGGKALEGKRE